ncbi:MAG TPA: VCBS repeat-containing protein [Oligoflexia bacterium]|nr:VCBS repeat-containing protein [Oligoflexia bacterium]HMR23954.1 VCBS repeat-containing protein [Oligoflexia bacterium]
MLKHSVNKSIAVIGIMLLGLACQACGSRAQKAINPDTIEVSFDYNLSDTHSAVPVFNGIRLHKNFNLYYQINSLKSFKHLTVKLANIVLNPGHQPVKQGSYWVDLESLGDDGVYNLDIIAIDKNNHVLQKTIKVFKNVRQYEHIHQLSYAKEENIDQHEAKFYSVGDINLDGFADAFLHIDSKPKILLGPDFQTKWDVSNDDWFSSTYTCDINGDGIKDLVLGNRYYGVAGKIKVYFGPMTSNKTFTQTVEYHGTHTYAPETGEYFEYAGASIGCANLEGNDKNTLMQFNANVQQNGLTVLPSKLDFFSYNETENTLNKNAYTEYSLLHSQYPNAIEGDVSTYFSNPKDINHDGHEDIIINGWYGPDSQYQVKNLSILYGSKNKQYYLGPVIHSRNIYDDILNDNINPLVSNNTFPKLKVSILDDVNQDNHLDYNFIYNECITSQNSCNYLDFNYLEVNQITSNQEIVYTSTHYIEQDPFHLAVKSFDFDGDGLLDYLFLNRNPNNNKLFFDVQLAYNNETLNFLSSLDLGESNEEALFLPITNNLGERFLLFVQSNSQGNWQTPSIINIKIFKDE